MTVSQIAQVLDNDNATEQFIQSLKNDSRVTVAQLLKKWETKQSQLSREKDRLHKLFTHERTLVKEGYQLIAGVDEAGRGPLAGPVVVGAVILPLNHHIPKLNDSKKLSAKQRMELYHTIKTEAVAVSHSVISTELIDKVNIYQATVHGMYQVISALNPVPHAVLIDAVPLPNLPMRSSSLINGDALSASIAAASIIAKVERDRIMDEYDLEYPEYCFSHHKGYGTAEHLAALQKYGPCRIHRKSFEPIKSWETKDCESQHNSNG